LALEQEVRSLLDYDTFDPDSPEGQTLQRLRNNRPASIKKAKQLEKEGIAARYSSEVAALIEQFQREHPDADERQLPILAAAEWFLNSPGRWRAEPVKFYALALKQEIEGLLEFDNFAPDSPGAQLLQRLENNPPAPLKKAKKTKKGEGGGSSKESRRQAPEKMLRFDPLRLPLVRSLARPFDRPSVSEPTAKKGNAGVQPIRRSCGR
jgi:hypothetical protein